MNITIYIPDDLGKRVRRMKGLSVSLVCRKALERALRRLEREDAKKTAERTEGVA